MADKTKTEIEIVGATIVGEAVVLPADALPPAPPAAKPVTVSTGGGSATQGNVVADQFTGRDDQRNYESHKIGNVTFQNPDNAVLLQAIFAIGDKVSVLDVKLDGLPERVRTLELRVPWVTWIMLAAIIGTAVLVGVFFAGRLSM